MVDDPYFENEIRPQRVAAGVDKGMVSLGFANPHSYHGAHSAVAVLMELFPGLIGSRTRRLSHGGFEIIVWRTDTVEGDAQVHLANWIQSRPSGIEEKPLSDTPSGS